MVRHTLEILLQDFRNVSDPFGTVMHYLVKRKLLCNGRLSIKGFVVTDLTAEVVTKQEL